MKAHEKFTGRESRVPGHVSLGLSFGLLASPCHPGLSRGMSPAWFEFYKSSVRT